MKQIYVPFGRDIVIDFIVIPKVEMDTSQVYIGCDGKFREKPFPFEICNRFITAGRRKHAAPGESDNNDYTDKHLFYHAVEPVQWPRRSPKTFGFKFRTRSIGSYGVLFYFIGEADRGELKNLTITVADSYEGKTMVCYNPEHKRCRIAAQWDRDNNSA